MGNVAANLFGVATISLPTDAVTEVVVIVRPVVAVLFEIRYYLCVAKAFELVARWYISFLAELLEQFNQTRRLRAHTSNCFTDLTS